MSRVVLAHLHCWYGQTHAVDDVTLVVGDGELCVLLGPTGCGKTSTLRMIAGFVRPAAGDIFLDGRRINDLYPGDRNIAMIFQSYALYPHMTVRQQFAFPLKATKMPAREIEQRIKETADFLHMHEFLDRYPGELSAGQQQRVAVGRALIRRPKLFLMDEPLSQLDARLRVEMRATLRRLQQDLGITTIYVTHDQMEAQSVADKIVVMNQGRIQQIGSPLEIYARPANLFVAGFIGSPPMNFLDCRLEQRQGQLYVCNDRFAFPLRPDLADRVGRVSLGQPLVLGIRPEHIRLSPEAQANAVPAEVYVLEPQSSELIVDLKLGDLILKMRGDKREIGFRPHLSQQVWMEFQQDHLHLFDKGTEVCIL
ncbi:MAG: ABC transporter ATP-binding protein [Anaerolineae bacterium]|nr:ABC transporter ATP-binding protein [Anaerolineae bacterium]